MTGTTIRASDNPAPAFIEQLRAARVADGLSQKTLSETLGWSQKRLSQYEAGYQAINPRILERWAQSVGRTITTQPAETHCRVCGCTEDNACDGGCQWVTGEDNTLEVDLCTTCAWTIARDAIASGVYMPADQLEPGTGSGFATDNEAFSGTTTSTDKAPS